MALRFLYFYNYISILQVISSTLATGISDA